MHVQPSCDQVAIKHSLPGKARFSVSVSVACLRSSMSDDDQYDRDGDRLPVPMRTDWAGRPDFARGIRGYDLPDPPPPPPPGGALNRMVYDHQSNDIVPELHPQRQPQFMEAYAGNHPDVPLRERSHPHMGTRGRMRRWFQGDFLPRRDPYVVSSRYILF